MARVPQKLEKDYMLFDIIKKKTNILKNIYKEKNKYSKGVTLFSNL